MSSTNCATCGPPAGVPQAPIGCGGPQCPSYHPCYAQCRPVISKPAGPTINLAKISRKEYECLFGRPPLMIMAPYSTLSSGAIGTVSGSV